VDERKFILISDDDGHWYVCPADKRLEAVAHFEAVDRYWSPDNDPEGDPPEYLDWLEPVGGAPWRVTFTGDTIE
jgi:hypothetical protein